MTLRSFFREKSNKVPCEPMKVKGIAGKKLGMTHIYSQEGVRLPVSVLELDKAQDAKELNIACGDFVDISGRSKGKGFAGGMKRWGWSGTPKTHGSMSHRRVGSIGASAYPSRVFKGKHMPGHMGNRATTIQNLEVIKVDSENSLLVVKGAVPGPKNSRLIVKSALKKKKKDAAPSK